ncbi:MAG: hypothetical protein HQK50_14040 [Oligoflexia bacterium]|nr:hypothetical protein [Oligoflexia bacterium]
MAKNGDQSKSDLTAIENLGEYLHVEDADVDKLLGVGEEAPTVPLPEEASAFEFSDTPEIPDTPDTPDSVMEELPETPFLEGATEAVETEFETVPEALVADVVEVDEVAEVEAEEGPGISFLESDEEASTEIESSFNDAKTEQTQASIKTTQENFQDLKDFANNVNYGKVEDIVIGSGGPPFSVVLKNIVYQEDADDILGVLREMKIVNDANKESMKKSLSAGQVLLSQLSEYQAIHLVHRIRRFKVEVMMGLSEEIHPPKLYANARGLVNKHSLRQNLAEARNIDDGVIDVKSILLATTPILEGYQILQYLGIASEHMVIREDELLNGQNQERPKQNSNHAEEIEEIEETEELTEDEKLLLKYYPTLDERYQTLANKLRPIAHKMKGNAVVGINYQLTPLTINKPDRHETSNYYKITCTGSVVIVR